MPKVTIGIPVFNGARFVERAVRSFLEQDFVDLEVIVADNASTDATLEICQRIAQSDSRVTILMSDRNRGAAPNFNRLVDVAKGVYFKWAAHDDWCSGNFVSTTVAALEGCPKAVLCYAPMGVEDDSGRVFRWHDEALPHLKADAVRRRYRTIAWSLRDPTQAIFGLIRTDVLRRTGRIQNSPEPDRILLSELALYGPFLRRDDATFVHYGPPGHKEHYADERIPLRRRSWVWLHVDNASRPKLASYRVLKAHLAALAGADHLTAASRCAMGMEGFIAMFALRIRSKLRRVHRWAGFPRHDPVQLARVNLPASAEMNSAASCRRPEAGDEIGPT